MMQVQSNFNLEQILSGRSWSNPKPALNPYGFDQQLNIHFNGPAPKKGTIPLETHMEPPDPKKGIPTAGERSNEAQARRNAETLESNRSHSERSNFDHRVDEEIRRQTSSQYPKNTAERVSQQVGGAIDPVDPKELKPNRPTPEALRTRMIDLEAKSALGVRDHLGVRFHERTRDMSLSKKRLGKGISALGATVIQQSFNGENDGAFETIGKTAAVYGGMSFAEHKLDKWAVSGTAKKRILEGIDVVKKEESILYTTKEQRHLKQHPIVEERGAKKFRAMRKGLGVAALTIAGAGILDLAIDGKHHLDVERQKSDAHQSNEKKAKQAAEKRQEMGYGHVDMGQIAIDMFNQRTGHYKMGNAKFQ